MTRSYHAAQADLKLTSLLHQPPGVGIIDLCHQVLKTLGPWAQKLVLRDGDNGGAKCRKVGAGGRGPELELYFSNNGTSL
jgi:hypothetical protein